MDINKYLNESIERVVATALRASSKSFREMRFVASAASQLRRSEQCRSKFEKDGVHIPPFLIASIASQCNLHCAGCYARASGSCGDTIKEDELTAEEWNGIFTQAGASGVSFILLAGGEPLLRRDIMEVAIEHQELIFPVFTNGTLIDASYLKVFNKHRHLLPILSIEGDENITDTRRGEGVSKQVSQVMKNLNREGILYGASITITSENMELVTSSHFISDLRKKGCGIIFFVEYVPAQAGSEHLVLSEAQRLEQEEHLKKLKSEFKNMVLIAFPGDEKFMGGCLAAGRGFFHINATGAAEPCPFSPFSDMNLRDHTLLEVLKSPLFNKLRGSELLELEHSGGCALFNQQEAIRALIKA